MADSIRAKLIKKRDRVAKIYGWLDEYVRGLSDAIAMIDDEPVKHGQWILEQNGSGVCSICNRSDHIDRLAKYCRFCGAKIDGGNVK